MSTTTPSVPAEYAALVDDTALVSPSPVPLEEAVRQHRRHRASAYAALVGALVVPDTRLPELLDVLAGPDPGPPLPVGVVVSGGAGGVEPAARWADGSPLVELRWVEVALRDPDDLAGNARRVAAAADRGPEVPVHVEPPPVTDRPGHGWLAALDEVAAAQLLLTLRTAGPPSVAAPAVAAFLEAALDREVPFRCAAGPGGPDAPALLLATRAALDGGDPAEVAAALEGGDPEAVSGRLAGVGAEALVRTRRWLTSFGGGRVEESVERLAGLGVLHP